MGVNSTAMGVEEGRIRYRFNKYLFPFVDCAITLYAESGEPVPISDIADCMREKYGIKGVRNVYEGRDAALDNGYVRDTPVGGRTRYVPTMEGVVNAGIYMGLQVRFGNLLNNVSMNTLFCLMRFMRFMTAVILAPKAFEWGSLYVSAVTTHDESWVAPLLLETRKTLGASENSAMGNYHEVMRGSVMLMFITLKALLGIEVRHLRPRYYAFIEATIEASIINSAELQALLITRDGKTINFDVLRFIASAFCNAMSRIAE
jgi:hypothetical protein